MSSLSDAFTNLQPGDIIYPTAGGPAMTVRKQVKQLVTVDGSGKVWKRDELTSVDPCASSSARQAEMFDAGVQLKAEAPKDALQQRRHPFDAITEAISVRQAEQQQRENEAILASCIRPRTGSHPPMSLDEAKATGIPDLWGDLKAK